MRILSLFDGMSCGMIAMLNAGVKIDRYVAYEIDEDSCKNRYAPLGAPAVVAKHNFQSIEEMGNVFNGDFRQYQGFDFLIGGSPCTYWSIAQTKDRETTSSGKGWDLFCQYTRALKEAKPQYFIYENNKSMAKGIRDAIRQAFGFEEVCINSALVSAQNRQRYYWVGRRNPDGTYSKVNVPQPKDRGILLRDVLDNGFVDREKAHVLKHQAGNARDYLKKAHTQVKFEPVRIPNYGNEDKARPCRACYAHKGSGSGSLKTEAFPENPSKQKSDYIAEPVATGRSLTDGEMDYMVRPTQDGRNHFDYGYIQDSTKDKGKCVTANISKGVPYNVCCVRVGCMPSPDGTQKNAQAKRVYAIEGKSVTQGSNGGGEGAKTGLYAVPVQEACPEDPVILQRGHGYNKGGIKNGKAPTLTANGDYQDNNHVVIPVPYAIPCEWDSAGIHSRLSAV